MCLAYPGRIVKIDGETATLDYGTEKRKARLIDGKYKIGDYAIVQGKIVIEKVRASDAKKWLEMMRSGKA